MEDGGWGEGWDGWVSGRVGRMEDGGWGWWRNGDGEDGESAMMRVVGWGEWWMGGRMRLVGWVMRRERGVGKGVLYWHWGGRVYLLIF